MRAATQPAEVALRLREPEGVPRGALILNHGRGTDENDLFPLLDQLDPDRTLLGVATGAPVVGLPPGGRHWYVVERVGFPHQETFCRSYDALSARLDRLLGEREIDWSRVALGGFSQGAVMSYAVALGPGRPSPAVLICASGFVPTVPGWQPDLRAREGLRALIHHGRRDPVIEVGFGRAARDLFGGAGLEVDYLESDAGHWLPPEVVLRMRAAVTAALGADSVGA